MPDQTGFPTQGELLRFAFDALGVLPYKRDTANEFDEKRRNTVRKTLKRLADEDCDLELKSGKMVQDLAYLVTGYVRSPRVNLMVGDIVFDLLGIHCAIVASEGTYLSKQETLRWLLSERIVPATAVAVARQIARHNVRAAGLALPEDTDWYLPDWDTGKCRWPLEKAMRWVYDLAGTSIRKFHLPNEESGEVQDLDNATNWLGDRSLPSAAVLAWTFERGFTAINQRRDSIGGTSLTAEQLDGARLALFVARAVTFVGKEVTKHFGMEFLQALCAKFKENWSYADDECQIIEWLVQQEMQDHSPLIPNMDALWWEAAAVQKVSLRHRAQEAGQAVKSLFERGNLCAQEIDLLVEYYGRLAVLPIVQEFANPYPHTPPDGFIEALFEADDLRKDQQLQLKAVDQYEMGLAGRCLEGVLPWVAPWLRAVYFYRLENFKQAFHWISLAYEAAKYRAGGVQYKIVNQYIELAAKANRRKEFEKGIQWARYIGMPVRWLRENEPSKENIDFVFGMMKMVRYGGL